LGFTLEEEGLVDMLRQDVNKGPKRSKKEDPTVTQKEEVDDKRTQEELFRKKDELRREDMENTGTMGASTGFRRPKHYS